MMNDALCVVHPRAAGLDVHKGHITATVRLCTQTGGEPQGETRTFGALASGLAALVAGAVDHLLHLVAHLAAPGDQRPPMAAQRAQVAKRLRGDAG